MNFDAMTWGMAALISALFTITWFSARNWINRTNEKLDELIREIGDLSRSIASHNERLNGIDDRFREHARRLDDHGRRIRKLEMTNKEMKNS